MQVQATVTSSGSLRQAAGRPPCLFSASDSSSQRWAESSFPSTDILPLLITLTVTKRKRSKPFRSYLACAFAPSGCIRLQSLEPPSLTPDRLAKAVDLFQCLASQLSWFIFTTKHPRTGNHPIYLLVCKFVFMSALIRMQPP